MGAVLDGTVFYRTERDCIHSQTNLVKLLDSLNRPQVVYQCCVCGEKVSGSLPHKGVDVAALPLFDTHLRDRKREETRQHRDRERYRYLDDLEQQRLSAEEKFWADYNHYLETDHWKQLRRRVISRDGFLCQNCFRRVSDASAQVHHREYTGFKRVGKSFAFECVTLCAACHTEFHPHMRELAESSSVPEW